MKIELTIKIHGMDPNGEDRTMDRIIVCAFPIDLVTGILKPCEDDWYQPSIVTFTDGTYYRLHMTDTEIEEAIKIIKALKGGE